MSTHVRCRAKGVSGRPFTLCRVALLVFSAFSLLTACETEPPTSTPIPTIAGAIPPSATVLPILPISTEIPGGNLDAQQFTPGAPIGITATVVATQPSILLTIALNDVVLIGDFYSASKRPAPTLILIHGEHEDRSKWDGVPSDFQRAGYNVVTVDLRGYGRSAGEPNWALIPNDVLDLINYVRTLPGIDPQRTALVGSGIGGTLAIATCAADPLCKAVIAISPRASEQNIQALSAMNDLARRPLFIGVSADDDPSAVESQSLINAAFGAHKIQRFAGKAHGLALIATHPELSKMMVDWLAETGKL